MADEGGRMVENVKLNCRNAASLDLDGKLHPSKSAVFPLVRRTVQYITTSTDEVRWRHIKFY